MFSTSLKRSIEVDASRPRLPAFTLTLTQFELVDSIRRQLSPTEDLLGPVVWREGDSEIVAYPPELRVSLRPGLILVELPVATDQTGKTSLVIPLSAGSSPGDAALVALTESLPRGNSLLAARWGFFVQEVVWAAVLNVGQARLASVPGAADMVVSGVYATDGHLVFIMAPDYKAPEIGDYFADVAPDAPAPAPPEPLPEVGQEAGGCLLLIIQFFNLILRLAGLPPYDWRSLLR